MLNIYYVTNMFPSCKDNYGIFCKKIYNFINSSKEFKIVLLSAIYGKSNNKYYNIFRYMKLLTTILFNILISIEKFDIIYIQYIWKHAFFIAGFINLLKKKEKKIILNFHGEDLINYAFLSKKDKINFKLLCANSVCIIVPSKFFMNKLLEIDESYRNSILVSPSGGIDNKIFFKYNKSIASESGTIVYCSRFARNKGWDDFIKAAAVLVKKYPHLNFVMLGYGDEVSAVKISISEYSLKQYISVVENPSQSLIANIYSQATLFVFPTRLQESLGLVALEAMSCGLPVIASDVGAIGEYVCNGKNGYLFPCGDINSLIEKIELYLLLPINEKNVLRDCAYRTAEKYKDEAVKTAFLNRLNNFCLNYDQDGSH